MKFGHVKIGASFEFDGQTYVKTSPMIGRNQSKGTQKFFRRAMEVNYREFDVDEKPELQNRSLSHTQVAEAFAEFYRQCEQCLLSLTPKVDEPLLQQLRGELEHARGEFWAKIN
jgi:hypothetical protein